MPDLRSFHAEVGRCWINAHRGPQSNAETTLLDIGFIILQKLLDSVEIVNERPTNLVNTIGQDVISYVNMAHSIFDPLGERDPHQLKHHE